MNQKKFAKNFYAYAIYGPLFTDYVKFEFNHSIPFNFLLKFLIGGPKSCEYTIILDYCRVFNIR